MRLKRGLYAITDPTLTPADTLVEQVRAAVEGGATAVQYRDKQAPRTTRRRQAEALLTLCQRRGVPLIINDDINLAATVGADGVHLGQADAEIQAARRQLGPSAIIGVSCYNELARARSAAIAGADYVAFGRFFPSQTKPAAVQAHPELLNQARVELNLPLVAIGGITPDNGGLLISAGADLLAVIHGIFGQADVVAASRRFAQLFDE